MKRSETMFGLLRIGSDAAAVAAATVLAYLLRLRNIDLLPGIQLLEVARTLPELEVYLRSFVVPAMFLFFVIAILLKLYLIRITLSAFRELSRIVLAVIVWVGCIMGWYFLVRHQLFYSRIILLHATGFAFLFLGAGRMFLTLLQRALLRRGIGVHTVLTLGAGPPPAPVERFLRHDLRYRYVGHVYALPLQTDVDLILQTDPSSSEDTNQVIDFCRSHHIGYAFLPPVLVDVPHLLSVYRFGSVPVLRFHPTPLDGWGAVYKQAADACAASTLLLLLSPLFLLLGLAIKIDSRGPIFFRHLRMGQGGKMFFMALKFRSMIADAEEKKALLAAENVRADGPLFKMKNDPRVTRIGKFLRRYSLDELPQLWNVIRGEMSLVGPRPHLPEEVARYSDFERRVFAVKPGITGLAQISGRSDLKFEDEVRLDLQYIEEWSPWKDLWILWRTVWVVLKGDNA